MAVKCYQIVLENVQKPWKNQRFFNKMKIDWQPCINYVCLQTYVDLLPVQVYTTDALKQLKVLSTIQCQRLNQEPEGRQGCYGQPLLCCQEERHVPDLKKLCIYQVR